MNIKRILRTRTALSAALIALAASAAIWAASPASRVEASRATPAGAIKEVDPRAFGMFGITQGQTARLNLVNLETGEFVPCIRVELSFVDSDGNTLLQKVYDVDRGKSAFLDLNGNQFVGRSGRAQIRALARFVGAPDTRDDPFFRNCLPTLEVIDNVTGRTNFIVSESVRIQKVTPTAN